MATYTNKPASCGASEDQESLPGSLSSIVLAEEAHLLEHGAVHAGRAIPGLERRRSSVTSRLAAVADIGGPNSFRSFARSWQRAASFAEVIPRHQSFILTSDHQPTEISGLDDIEYSRNLIEGLPPSGQQSLLRQHLEISPFQGSALSPGQNAEGGMPGMSTSVGGSGLDFRPLERNVFNAEMSSGVISGTTPSSRSSIFATPPLLGTPSIVGSYGSYGATSSSSVRRHSGIVQVSRQDPTAVSPYVEEEEDDDDAAHGENHPILIKEIKQGDQVILAVEGQSTLPQSVFNSINALIGVGLLSLPLAIKMSGWIIGLSLLTLTAAVTGHTGNLLGKCMDHDTNLITYSDLAYVSFGSKARVIVSALFSLELVAACVALIILFADSIDLLFPGLGSVTMWKCVCSVLILVLCALPLRWLSYTSIVGIFSTFCIVCIVIIDGFFKEHSPGSLREPATTYLFPSNWLVLPLAYGLLASPWGAHSVFPSIYRDMRHPNKWNRAIKVTFSVSYGLDASLAVIGVIMFGDDISEAITSNILKTPGYLRALSILMCVFIAIIPLTKIPLNARPLITTVDVMCGLHPHHRYNSTGQISEMALWIYRGLIRIGVVLTLLGTSVLFPAFDSVCAFLGAALCTLISIVLPISFYLKLFWGDVSLSELVVLFSIAIFFSILGLIGTIWAFLPRTLLHI